MAHSTPTVSAHQYLRAFRALFPTRRLRRAAAAGATLSRNRKLPRLRLLAILITWFFQADRGLPAVYRWLLRGDDCPLAEPSLYTARQRLGWAPLRWLRRHAIGPLACPRRDPDAFYHGHRLLALDGTTFTVADTPANERTFGRPRNQHGAGGYPQARVAAICEVGTHALLDWVIRGYRRSESDLARRLLRRVPADRTQIVQVDIDPTMLGRDYPVPHTVVGDCRQTLEQLCAFADGPLRPLAESAPTRRLWAAELKKRPAHFDTDNLNSDATPIHPARLIGEMRRALPRDTILFVDSGAHRAFAGHYWESFGPGGVRSATNLGPMGWAIPAAIGGKLARPDAPVAVITGDGCMRMHGIEIATAARYRVPVLFVVSNNSALGNVYLRARKENAGAAEMTLLPQVDWAVFGRVLGAGGARVEAPGDLAAALRAGAAAPGPFVVDVVTQRDCLTPVSPYNTMAAEYAHAHHD